MPDVDDYGLLLLEKKEAERAVREIEDRIQEMVGEMVNQALDAKYDPNDLVVGSWDCLDSPLESCVYDDEDDRNHDSCLFCGEPSERK